MTAPTAQASVALTVTTPSRALVPGAKAAPPEALGWYPARPSTAVAARLGTSCHPVKLEVPKARPSWRVSAEPGIAPPTAQRMPPGASAAEVSRSSGWLLPSVSCSGRVASGAWTMDQEVPFQCSVNVSQAEGVESVVPISVSYPPTSQTSSTYPAVTPRSAELPTSAALAGWVAPCVSAQSGGPASGSGTVTMDQ